MAQTRRLRATNLSCHRGGRLVFSDLSFEVAPGESLLLSGPNGAGKTTLLRLVAGLLPLEDGKVGFDPEDEDAPLSEALHYVGHANGIKTSFSVMENLSFWASFYDAENPAPERLDEALAAFGLDGIARLPAALLSAGQRRKLTLCRLLVSDRPVWLLDEPSVSLDTASTKRLSKAIKDHLAQGGMAIVASHTPLALRFTHRLELGKGARP